MAVSPVPLRDLLPTIAEEMGIAQQLRAVNALLHWQEAVGENVAAAALPEAFKGGKVFVAVKSSAWLQELRFHEQTILERLNQMAGAPIFTELVLRVRPLPKRRPQSKSSPSEPEPSLDEETISRLHSLTEPIADAEMRAKVTEQIIAYYRLTQLRRQAGWQVCQQCGCVHPKPESALCFFCLSATER